MKHTYKAKRSVVSVLLASVLFLLPLTSCGNKANKPPVETESEPAYSELQWPKSEIAALLSAPKSNVGRVEWEASHGFVIYVADTPQEDYNTYVDECWDRGFTVDYNKGDDYFWAQNEDGYKVTVRLEEDDVMFIRMDEPPEDFEPADVDEGYQTITFWGLEFSFPSYFDVRSEDSTDHRELYYPEKEDYYSSLLFFVEDAEGVSQAEFDEAKDEAADKVLAERLEGATEILSESATIGGLSGWTIFCRQNADSENPSTTRYSFVFNPDNEVVIYICLFVDDADQSNYDYVEDYQKILTSAKVVSASEPASGIRQEFKKAMDSYEAFFDEYVAFMKKYEMSSDPTGLLPDYTDYMSRYADMMSKLEAIGEGELSDEELKYYTETMARVSQKLLDVVS